MDGGAPRVLRAAASDEDLERDPASFVRVGDRVLANGRDPYFPAWPDVVQLNAFSPDLRGAVIDTLGSIADAVRRRPLRHGDADDERRLRAHLGRARRARGRPTDYWPTRDPARSRAAHPDFVFLAEAYWDLEFALQQQGFDYCYDKRLYDRLVHEGAESVHGHLSADIGLPAAGSSASSRTTTSRARPRRSRPGRRARPRSRR